MSPALPASSTFLDFWTERRLCTVTTLRPDGTPHVVPMGVVIDPDTGTAWAITSRTSRKARNLADGGPIAICCVDGRHWSTIEGTGVVLDDPETIAEAERRYAERYKVPRENPNRVVIRITVDRVIGNIA